MDIFLLVLRVGLVGRSNLGRREVFEEVLEEILDARLVGDWEFLVRLECSQG